jgi:hypothetical protein
VSAQVNRADPCNRGVVWWRHRAYAPASASTEGGSPRSPP